MTEPESAAGPVLRLAIVTGDHTAADPTKLGAAWGPEDLACHEAMVEAVQGLGRFRIAVFDEHRELFLRLREFAPDLVVNFCDTGIGNNPSRELHLPARLELEGFPYTGATPQAMVLCYDKQVVRLVAAAAGIPVPAEHFLDADALDGELPETYPALLKPNCADGSVGITKDAVVRDPDEARAYLAFLRRELPGRAVLWQEYLPGPEFGIGLIGNPDSGLTVLPALEVDFSRLPAGFAPILSFESKADPASPYWHDIGFRAAALDDAVGGRMQSAARWLFGRFGLRDYGRFDFRCNARGEPALMEVNPNPAWANDGKLAWMAGFAGWSYPQMLAAILDAAIERIGRGAT